MAEIILGLMFLVIFIRSVLAKKKEPEDNLFGTRTLHRLAFKGSVMVFVFFSTGDILSGDRRELWEHGTFFVMALVSYYLYVQHETIEAQEENEIARAEKWANLSPSTS